MLATLPGQWGTKMADDLLLAPMSCIVSEAKGETGTGRLGIGERGQ